MKHTRFPTTLRLARQAQGVSQPELAQAAGLRQATVSLYESGKLGRSVSRSRGAQLRIASALGVDVAVLFPPPRTKKRGR